MPCSSTVAPSPAGPAARSSSATSPSAPMSPPSPRPSTPPSGCSRRGVWTPSSSRGARRRGSSSRRLLLLLVHRSPFVPSLCGKKEAFIFYAAEGEVSQPSLQEFLSIPHRHRGIIALSTSSSSPNPSPSQNPKRNPAMAANLLGEEERVVQKSYWTEHSKDLTVEAMMLDSRASNLDKEERPELPRPDRSVHRIVMQSKFLQSRVTATEASLWSSVVDQEERAYRRRLHQQQSDELQREMGVAMDRRLGPVVFVCPNPGCPRHDYSNRFTDEAARNTHTYSSVHDGRGGVRVPTPSTSEEMEALFERGDFAGVQSIVKDEVVDDPHDNNGASMDPRPAVDGV